MEEEEEQEAAWAEDGSSNDALELKKVGNCLLKSKSEVVGFIKPIKYDVQKFSDVYQSLYRSWLKNRLLDEFKAPKIDRRKVGCIASY